MYVPKDHWELMSYSNDIMGYYGRNKATVFDVGHLPLRGIQKLGFNFSN